MTKIWYKPLHKRKVWKTMSLYSKTTYYLKPFMNNLFEVWLQPLPFPTLFKILYSCVLIMLMLLPVIFPITVIISYYAIVQYILESALGIVYPRSLDFIHYTFQLFNFEIKNAKHVEFVNLYVERWRYIATAFASCVDYVRLALAFLLT